MKIERTGQNAGKGFFGNLSGRMGQKRGFETVNDRHCDRKFRTIVRNCSEAIRCKMLRQCVILYAVLRPNGLLHSVPSLSLQNFVRNDGHRRSALRPTPKNRHEENHVFTYFLLIFYCYLLILVNELSVK